MARTSKQMFKGISDGLFLRHDLDTNTFVYNKSYNGAVIKMEHSLGLGFYVASIDLRAMTNGESVTMIFDYEYTLTPNDPNSFDITDDMVFGVGATPVAHGVTTFYCIDGGRYV